MGQVRGGALRRCEQRLEASNLPVVSKPAPKGSSRGAYGMFRRLVRSWRQRGRSQAKRVVPPSGDDKVAVGATHATEVRQAYLFKLGVPCSSCSQRQPLINRHRTKSDLSDKISLTSFSSTTTPPCGSDDVDSGAGSSADHSDSDMLSGGNFRLSFLQRLSREDVWVPEPLRAKRSQTAIVFDWDDTLLCTSFLTDRGEASNVQMRAMGAASVRILETAKQLGKTFVITNAKAGWVESSAKTFAPELLSALAGVEVISARKYEHFHPGNFGQWKVLAFAELMQHLNASALTNLVALGDAEFELNAARQLAKAFSDVAVKTVKFSSLPTPQELTMQLCVAEEALRDIVRRGKSQDMILSAEVRSRRKRSSSLGAPIGHV